MRFVRIHNDLIYKYGSKLSKNAVYLYMVIVDRTFNEQGMHYAFGSDQTFSKWTGIGRGNIPRYRKELLDAGLIKYFPEEGKLKSRYYPQLRVQGKEYVCIPTEELLYNKNLTAAEKVLFTLFLMTFNEEYGYAFPSKKKIAQWLRISEKTVYNLIISLESKHFVRVETARYKQAYQNNRYIPLMRARHLKDERQDDQTEKDSCCIF